MAIARLIQGGAEIDLTAAPYYVSDDFIPPPANVQRAVSMGTSYNKFGGGELVSETARNQRFAFTVQVRGSTAGEIQSAINRLSAFLNGYKAPEPLYIEHSPYNIPAPSWGTFCAPVRYRVVSADVRYTADYGSAKLRESGVRVTVTVDVAPGAINRPQKVANAKGGIAIETIPGMDTPLGFGLMNVTNLFTNPIFGNSTWSTGWSFTATTGRATKNIDPEYKMFDASARLQAAASGMGTMIYNQSPTYTASRDIAAVFVIKMIGGATPTSSDCRVFIGSVKTTSFYPLGNGFFAAYGTSTSGVGGAIITGLQIEALKTVYLCSAFVAEYVPAASGRSIPLTMHGDMLGCSWSGARHTSTTTTSQGQITLDATNIINPAKGAIAVTWTPTPVTPVRGMFFEIDATVSATGLATYFEAAWYGNTIYFDGLSAADVNTAMQPAHYVFVWGSSGKKIYKNGVLIASNADQVPLSFDGPLQVSTHASSGLNYSDGIYNMFQCYPDELTAAQVAELYSQSSRVIDAGYACNIPPFLWTKDGDGVLDAVNDSSRDNWGVLAGVPGTLPAEIELSGSQTVGVVVASHLSINPLDLAYNPGNLYDEAQGTADAACSGGQYQTFAALAGVATEIGTANITDPAMARDMVLGRDWYAIVRLREAAGTGTVTAKLRAWVGGQYYDSEQVYFATDTSFRLQRIGPVTAPALDYLYNSAFDITSTAQLQLFIWRTSGGAADMRVDFIDFVPAPLAYLEDTGTNNTFILKGDQVTAFASSAYSGANAVSVYLGDVIEAEPGKYNNIVIHVGKPGSAHTITNTLTASMYVTPRWSLL